ncbi:hypothetical protein EVAR_82366_1 [Eumeta japonica]|uniref:Uncharacterized protein n=1 Tax=Eumeta variegata TaxID=151549 RepID=A0A4C1UA00_EUMVA|nr:hypothetical protein EVAR_82366_1 [Eumeta japonica]
MDLESRLREDYACAGGGRRAAGAALYSNVGDTRDAPAAAGTPSGAAGDDIFYFLRLRRSIFDVLTSRRGAGDDRALGRRILYNEHRTLSLKNNSLVQFSTLSYETGTNLNY